jgi:hypothetical protein
MASAFLDPADLAAGDPAVPRARAKRRQSAAVQAWAESIGVDWYEAQRRIRAARGG